MLSDYLTLRYKEHDFHNQKPHSGMFMLRSLKSIYTENYYIDYNHHTHLNYG